MIEPLPSGARSCRSQRVGGVLAVDLKVYSALWPRVACGLEQSRAIRCVKRPRNALASSMPTGSLLPGQRVSRSVMNVSVIAAPLRDRSVQPERGVDAVREQVAR